MIVPFTQTQIQNIVKKKYLPIVKREEQHLNQNTIVPSTRTQVQNIIKKNMYQ